MLQFFVFHLLLAKGSDGGKGILVTEAPGHFIHLVTGFFRPGFRQFHIDAVGGDFLFFILASPEGLHHKVYQGAKRYEDDQRKDILGLFEIYFNHGSFPRCYSMI